VKMDCSEILKTLFHSKLFSNRVYDIHNWNNCKQKRSCFFKFDYFKTQRFFLFIFVLFKF
jgi:hypothetical protein